MRISITIATGVCLLVAGTAWGQFKGDGSKAPAVKTTTEAKAMPDDSRVTLEGHVVKMIRPEHYMFRDAKGEVEVEIDDHLWQGREIKAETEVRILGEVDKERNHITIDVKAIEVLPK